MNGWWSGQKFMDPTKLESCYANEDGMAFMDILVHEELSEEGLQRLERVRDVLDQLPPREADFIELYYFKQIKQTDIATIFGVSQPTVCYRLQRAALRIQFLLSLPSAHVDAEQIRLSGAITDPVDIEILVLMQRTTCQSEVAKILGVSQGFVRHRFMRSIAKLRNVDGMEDCVALLDKICNNLNILREVQRPNLDSKVMRVVM